MPRHPAHPLRIPVIALLAVLAVALAVPALAQTVDTRLWVPDFQVFSLVKDGNTLYVGGLFQNIGPWTGGGVRFAAGSNTPDPALSPPVRGTVRAAIPDGAGGWFIAGSFDSVGGLRRPNLARINADGSVHPFNGSTTDEVRSIVLRNGVLYAGGVFFNAGGQSRSRLAAFNATTGALTSWNPNSGGSVDVVAAHGTSIYVGGVFTTMGGQPRVALASVDTAGAGAVTTWNPAVADTFSFFPEVTTLAVSGTTLYAGGRFSKVGTAVRMYAAAFDLGTGNLNAWYPRPDNELSSITPNGANVYLCGQFTTLNTPGTTRYSIGEVNATTGTVTSWAPDASGANTVAVVGGDVYVGGGFKNAGGQSRNYLASFHPTTGALTAWNPMASQSVSVVAVQGTDVYVGGFFEAMNVLVRNNLAAIDLTTGAATGWNPNANSQVNVMALLNGKLYVGGQFSNIGGTSRNRIAAIHATTGAVLGWNPNSSSSVNALAIDSGRVYIGGQFTTLGGQPRNRLAAVDTAGVLLGWDPNCGGVVNALAIGHGRVYAGGVFTLMSATTRNRVAALDPVTGALLAWNPNCSGQVHSIAPTASRVYVGGQFNNIGGATRNFAAALDPVTASAFPWHPSPTGPVREVLPAGDRAYIGGTFTQVGASARSRIAAVDTTAGGVRSWSANLDYGTVDVLIREAGTIYIGGEFRSIRGVRRPFLAAVTDPTITVAVGPGAVPGPRVRMGPPMPQPSRGRATLAFELPEASRVELALYDLGGRRVRSLIDGEQRAAGRHSLAIHARGLAPGVYLARLYTEFGDATQRVVTLGE